MEYSKWFQIWIQDLFSYSNSSINLAHFRRCLSVCSVFPPSSHYHPNVSQLWLICSAHFRPLPPSPVRITLPVLCSCCWWAGGLTWNRSFWSLWLRATSVTWNHLRQRMSSLFLSPASFHCTHDKTTHRHKLPLLDLVIIPPHQLRSKDSKMKRLYE